jgi:hypothetical protein
MSLKNADRYRAQAELSFRIAECLSDHVAAEGVRADARRYERLADKLDEEERKTQKL